MQAEASPLTPEQIRKLEGDIEELSGTINMVIANMCNRPEGLKLSVLGAAIATVIGNFPLKDELWKSVQSALMRGPTLRYDERKEMS